MTKKVSRRSFVKIAGVAGAGIAGAAAASPAHSLVETVRQAPVTPKNAESAQETLAAASNQKLYVFFTLTEAAFVEAAVDRLIPKDNAGPGALELDVAHYIDLQLAGTYGNGERMYLEGPFGQGAETQGYQLPLRPREVYRIAIEDLDNYCRASFSGQVFAKLPGGDQDKVLTGLQEGKIPLVDISCYAA